MKNLKTFENYDPLDNLVDIDKEPMLRGYLECAIFADLPEEYIGEFSSEDIAKESLEEARKDVDQFKSKSVELLKEMDKDTLNRAGMDFWYSRNGHGTGFFDREELYGKEVSEKLQETSESFPTKNLFVEDGKVHIE